jgi:hypothetical protein
MSAVEAGLSILALHIENVRGAKRITVYPKKTGSVKVKGKNAAGKSSVLDAIQYALGGKAVQPQKPIRHGETSAMVVADLGPLTVKRTWTEKNSYLTVERKSPEGLMVPVPSAQTFLDELCGQGIGFDPLAFIQQKPAQQVEMLLGALALPEDPRALDATRKELYDTRTMVNRQVKSAEAAVVAAPPIPDAPEAEVSVAAILADFQQKQATIKENEEARRVLESRKQRTARAEAEIERLRSLLVDAEAELAEAQMEQREGETLWGALVDPDVTGLQASLTAAETTNASVRLRQSRIAHLEGLRDSHQKAVDESGSLTRQLEALDKRKTALLTQAAFPIPHLSITEDGKAGYVVTYKNVPLADCSSSEQLRVSMALSAALNPKVKVLLVQEGSLLDQEALATIETWAVENGCQVWLEIVSDDPEEGAFVIEAGEVKE